MDSDSIKEGFICPMCMKDFDIPQNLVKHFEESHASEKDTLRQLRGMFDKAKRKILKKHEEPEPGGSYGVLHESVGEAKTVARGTDPFLWGDDQEFGASRSHLRQYKERRDAEIDRFVVETNKILIRLEKLLRSGVCSNVKNSPLPGSRKSKEKSLVPWIADSEVKFCLICHKQFNLARRRHHCRLCGGIMCSNCSTPVTVSFALKLLKLDKTLDQPRQDRRKSRDDTDEPGIRSCKVCADLLVRHEKQQREKETKPPIVQLYEKMKQSMAEAEKLHPIYIKMANSLNLGDIQYDLTEAAQVRIKLIKTYEAVDIIAKKLGALGTQDEKPPSASFMKLQRGIRAFAAGYLQENMFTLPNLPQQDQVEKLQKQRADNIARKAAEDKAERERAMEKRLAASKLQHQRQHSGDFTQHRRQGSGDSNRAATLPGHLPGRRTASGGWGPVSTTINPGSSPDPLLEQIDIIRNYIKQAKEERRMDEVETLERNLMELEEEYFRQNR